MLCILLAILSCCANVVLLETLLREVPGCGNVVTFFQFLFVAVEGIIFTSKFGKEKPVVPLKNYIVLVVMFFAVSVANNWALNFDISMPLHMIFKSGSLVTSMFMGRLLLKKKYTVIKYFSVFMVSCGIFLATWASYRIKTETNNEANVPVNQSLIGIALMSFALILSAGLGIYQETLFKKYGKHPKEALFYSHMLPLPGFLLLMGDIYPQLHLFSKSDLIELFIFNIPLLWLYLIGNVITQYICVRSVFTIAAKYSSLTVTMIITFRKFVSLLFSIIYFQNPFTNLHWFATFLVFLGTLLFTDLKNLRSQTKKLK